MGLMRDTRQIGEEIRVRRIALGMSQERLGELLGVSYQQVQKYERGASRLSSDRLQQVASALGIPPAQFFRDSEGKGPTRPSGKQPRAEFRKGATTEEEELLTRFNRLLGSRKYKILIRSLLKALRGECPTRD